MTLEVGTRLGSYEVVSLLGAGGMGEVYRARDSRLGREVAIKLLLEEVAGDPERLARFEREARVLASLNHPHIATLHGFEADGATKFLVMELVSGETLADRIARGPIPVGEAIPIFLQIAEGLEAAHERGVIHRDLKPSNLKIAGEDGAPQVKILDFGLAKALAPLEAAPGSDPMVSASPTLTLAATMRGEILGTAAYMSPEQASGKTVDKRTDVWAFGVCLYEALTGRRAFQGEDAPNTLAAVLRDEIDLERLPSGCPRALRRGLERCLTRDRGRRLHDIGDMRLELLAAAAGEPGEGGAHDAGVPVAAPARWPPRALLLGGAVGVACGIVAAVLLPWRARDAAPPPGLAVERFVVATVDQPDDQLDLWHAISPDARRVAYTTRDGLWIRELDQLVPRLLDDTAGAQAPFWSPAGDWLGYRSRRSLWRVRPEGGSAAKICDLPLSGRSTPSWGESGDILLVVGESSTGIALRVSAHGGAPETFLEPDRDAGELVILSIVHLPGGREIAVGIQRLAEVYEIQIRLATGGAVVSSRASVVGAGGLAYSPSGHLLYSDAVIRPPELWAMPISLPDRAFGDEPFLVSRGVASPSVARDGTLVVRTLESSPDRLLWVSRGGEPLGHIGDSPGWISAPALSSDGAQIVFTGGGNRQESDLFVLGAGRATATRLTVGGSAYQPTFSPAGDRIYYVNGVADALFSLPLDGGASGTPEAVLDGGRSYAPDWSADGRYLVFHRVDPVTRRDLWYVDVEAGGGATLYLEAPRDQLRPRISPDGRYVAYESDERDERQVFVETFPVRTRRWQISDRNGRAPRWSPRGDEIFFVSGNDLMAAPVTLAPSFESGPPRKLFGGGEVAANFGYEGDLDVNYAVAPDAERFLVVQNLNMGRGDLVLVRNWELEIEALAASRR